MAHTNAASTDSLELFAERLMQEQGTDALDEEIAAQMKKDLVSRAEDRINAAILVHLPPEKLPAFETVIDAGDQEAIQAFAKKEVPDLDGLVASELMQLRTSYLNG